MIDFKYLEDLPIGPEFFQAIRDFVCIFKHRVDIAFLNTKFFELCTGGSLN